MKTTRRFIKTEHGWIRLSAIERFFCLGTAIHIETASNYYKVSSHESQEKAEEYMDYIMEYI